MKFFKSTFQELYKKNGFVLIKDYLTKNEADSFVKYINDIQSWNAQKNKWMIYYETNQSGRKQKSRIENFIKYHEHFKAFTYNKINPIVTYVNNENMVLFKEKINLKEPGGNGFKAHQDYPAWSDFPPKFFCTAALFANSSNSNNGCLEFSAFDNKKGLLPFDISKGGHINDDISNKLEWESIETTPRDIVIFDSFVPHKSGDNNSLEERRNVYLTYNRRCDGYYYDSYIDRKRLEFPPEIERDANKTYSKYTRYNLANPID